MDQADGATVQPQVNAIAVSPSEEFWDPDDVNSGVARKPNSVGEPLDPEGDASANFSTTINFVGEFLDPEEAFPLDVVAHPQIPHRRRRCSLVPQDPSHPRKLFKAILGFGLFCNAKNSYKP